VSGACGACGACGANHRPLRRVALAFAALLALLGLTPFGMAGAQPQPIPDGQNRMRLELESLSPRVITSATSSITVTGTVTNTGDRRIDDVRVQLRRGEPLETEQQLREARTRPTDSAPSPFVLVGDTLAPGQTAQITLTVPVRAGEGSLRIEKPGVYPLLVNVNGRPEFSGKARLATAFVLLPALSVPGGTPPTPAQRPDRLTVLWPLIDDFPRQLGTGADGRAVLTDDDLADSLAPGGRLYGLTSAVQQAVISTPALVDALCFAIDPDLVQTATLMVAGYHVRTSSGIVDGRGAAAAKTWLDRLKTLTTGRCVITLPFADADLMALSAAGEVNLQQLAVTSGAAAAELAKPVPALTGVYWPVGGTIDQRTLADLAANGPITVLADPSHLRRPEGTAPYGVGGPATGDVRALPIDSLVSTFLDPPKDERQSPVQAVQNGLAALIFRTTFSARDANTGRSILIAPPRRWSAPATELTVFLQAMQQVVTDGQAAPTALGPLVSGAVAGTSTGLDYTAQDSAAEVAPSVLGEVTRIFAAQRDLAGAMTPDDTHPVDPNTLVAPLKLGLVRATSSAWRGHLDLAQRMVAEVGAQLDALRGLVTVVSTGRPLTLASGNSPIPVLLTNGMPVSVRVRIKLADTPGLRPEPIQDMVIPAGSSINPYLAVEVTRAGRFTVDVSVSTPGGTPLGSTARLELTSTSYGSVTLIIIGSATGALFLLAGLRIFRRIRAARMAGTTQGPTEDGVD
jgi:hypothetical protein